MLGWDEELSELTPQRREEKEKWKQEKYIKDGERGRRLLRGMLILYLGMQIVSLILGFFTARKEEQVGNYIFLSLVQGAVTAVILCGLWRGREWARVFFAVLLVIGMLFEGRAAAKLLLVQEEPLMITWGIYEDTPELQDSGTKSLFAYEQEVMTQYQEWKKERAAVRKYMAAAYLADIIICAGFLYFLYGYSPIKIFFEQQEHMGNLFKKREEGI